MLCCAFREIVRRDRKIEAIKEIKNFADDSSGCDDTHNEIQL